MVTNFQGGPTAQLLLFAKYPEPGKVKTRLARQIGAERAASFYKEMVETVVRKTTPLNEEYRQILCFDPPRRREDFEKWFPSLQLLPQGGGDLGMRMEKAIGEVFETGAKRVLVIGTDCVEIDRTLIQEAFQKLERSDLVIGPATDGGYYLIGMKIPPGGDLFTGIPWSTNKVFEVTMKRAKEASLRIALLKELSDIDEAP